ncbi:MAG: FMN-binding protein [Actinomycetota bacterium]|nr:FMN-binding protein [Actinomycetota bacterium]
MTSHRAQRSRRAAGLAGLLGAVGLLVTAKQLAGPPGAHHLALTTSATSPATPSSSTPSSSTPSSSLSSSPPPGASPVPGPVAPATTATTAGGIRQITGSAEDNPYGTIQVRVTLSGGRVTDVSTLQSPSDRGRSVDIAQQALPLLRQEVLKAQSAQIDVVSGASYDSQGYAQSVQSALDKARA